MTTMPDELRKKNIRLAIALGALAIFVFIGSIPYWETVLTTISKGAG